MKVNIQIACSKNNFDLARTIIEHYPRLSDHIYIGYIKTPEALTKGAFRENNPSTEILAIFHIGNLQNFLEGALDFIKSNFIGTTTPHAMKGKWVQYQEDLIRNIARNKATPDAYITFIILAQMLNTISILPMETTADTIQIKGLIYQWREIFDHIGDAGPLGLNIPGNWADPETSSSLVFHYYYDWLKRCQSYTLSPEDRNNLRIVTDTL